MTDIDFPSQQQLDTRANLRTRVATVARSLAVSLGTGIDVRWLTSVQAPIAARDGQGAVQAGGADTETRLYQHPPPTVLMHDDDLQPQRIQEPEERVYKWLDKTASWGNEAVAEYGEGAMPRYHKSWALQHTEETWWQQGPTLLRWTAGKRTLVHGNSL